MKSRAIAIFFLFAASLAANGQATYQLKLAPKAGDVFKFKYKAVFHAGDVDATATSDHIQTIKKIDTNGDCSFEWMDKGFTIAAPGAPDTPVDLPAVSAKYSALGDILDVTAPSDDQLAGFVASLTMLRFSDKPVKIGDSWDFETKGNSATGLMAMKAHYTLEGTEKMYGVDSLKVMIDLAQQGSGGAAKSKGEIWIDPTTGWTVKADLTWSDFPAPGGGTTDVHVTLDREP
jgi:hypothetical protein